MIQWKNTPERSAAVERAVAVVNVIVLRDRDIGRAAMNSVEDLDVFKLAHQLALKTYFATKTFPKEETYSLGDQTRRTAS